MYIPIQTAIKITKTNEILSLRNESDTQTSSCGQYSLSNTFFSTPSGVLEGYEYQSLILTVYSSLLEIEQKLIWYIKGKPQFISQFSLEDAEEELCNTMLPELVKYFLTKHLTSLKSSDKVYISVNNHIIKKMCNSTLPCIRIQKINEIVYSDTVTILNGVLKTTLDSLSCGAKVYIESTEDNIIINNPQKYNKKWLENQQ